MLVMGDHEEHPQSRCGKDAQGRTTHGGEVTAPGAAPWKTLLAPILSPEPSSKAFFQGQGWAEGRAGQAAPGDRGARRINVVYAEPLLKVSPSFFSASRGCIGFGPACRGAHRCPWGGTRHRLLHSLNLKLH